MECLCVTSDLLYYTYVSEMHGILSEIHGILEILEPVE